MEFAEDMYQEDSILACKLYVRFEGEAGVDLEGITRDFFSAYWRSALARCTAGQNHLYLKASPGCLVNRDKSKAMGRILLHGFLVCSFLPHHLHNATLYAILTGNVTSQ